MAILRYILPAALALLLTGCYADFDPETDTKPVLCLNSMITAGEPIEVKVTHTWLYTDTEAEKNHLVTDAKVTVFANDQVVGSEYLAAEGDRIRIVADSPVYGTASAEVEVPRAVPVEKVTVKPVVTDMWLSDQALAEGELLARMNFMLNIEMDIDDLAEVDNYFKFDYNWYTPTSEDGEGDIYSHPYYYSSLAIRDLDFHAEPIFKEHVSLFDMINGDWEYSDFFYFTDRQFAGKTYPLHLNFQNCFFDIHAEAGDDSLFDCGVNIYLATVSKSSYNWALYQWNVDEGILLDLSDLGLAESRWGYSNVSTCAGVVAARTLREYKIDLKDFLMQTISEYKQQ